MIWRGTLYITQERVAHACAEGGVPGRVTKVFEYSPLENRPFGSRGMIERELAIITNASPSDSCCDIYARRAT